MQEEGGVRSPGIQLGSILRWVSNKKKQDNYGGYLNKEVGPEHPQALHTTACMLGNRDDAASHFFS